LTVARSIMCCSRWWLLLGALVSGLSVAAGAFGAHGLDRYFHATYADSPPYEKKARVDGREVVISRMPLAEKYLADFKTAAEYQMYHGLALLAVGFLARKKPSRSLTIAGCCFLAGVLGFSGGLYGYSLTGTRWLGMTIVPLGGVLFLVGWGALAAAVCPCGQIDQDPIDIEPVPANRRG
jgi:uncharacterized membrane protein YgdD (TMEM256/DUF423 family)